jgi:hypothetical protein
MASFFKLVLDTTAPLNPVFQIEGGLPITGDRLVEIMLKVDDETVTGYQFKIWGDVDPTFSADIQPEEEDSNWINLETAEHLLNAELSEGDGAKTLFCQIRDDVWNYTEVLEASIELDTSIATITITSGPSVPKISLDPAKTTATATFKANEDLVAWEVRVVPNSGSTHEDGEVVGSGGGSTGAGGELEAETNEELVLKGTDLVGAGMVEGDNVIKVFGQNKAGNWSV